MDGKVVIGTEMDTSMIDKQIDLLTDKLEGLEQEYKILEEEKPFEGQTKELIKLGNEISTTKKKLSRLTQEKEKMAATGFSEMSVQLDGIGKSLKGITKKVVKWGFAVFGIRSAFMFVRSAINTIAGDDEQLKADIDYMKNAIAYTLEPLIRGIVNLAKQLLFYIQYIVRAWTGKNIFENANKGLASANKQAKELKKTTAGFDEMNVLSDSSSGSGGATPSFDLNAPEDIDAPGWVKYIAENKDEIIGALLGIAGGILAIKLGLDGFIALGIGLIIYGIYETIKGIVDFVKDPSWENFGKILEGLTLILTGVAIAMLAVNAANPTAWIILAIALVTALAATIIKHWDKIKEVLGKIGGWIYDHIIKPVGDFFSNLWNGIKTAVSNTVQWVKDKFSSIISFFSNLIGKIVGLFKEIGTKVGDVIGGAFKAVINGVLWAIENILNFPIRTINSLIRTINKIPGINIGTLSEFSLPRLAKGGIINQPGKGVMVGSAIAGERGQEGVIPLTDSQQMALLGEAIGKYITVNATVINQMNGRVLSRELQKVKNESDFAYNR